MPDYLIAELTRQALIWAIFWLSGITLSFAILAYLLHRSQFGPKRFGTAKVEDLFNKEDSKCISN